MKGRKTILITGFEKFGEYRENITEVLNLTELSLLMAHSVERLIFPVRIFSGGAENYGKQIVAKAKEIKARAIISLGMDSDVYGLRIESKSVNWVENIKYCLPSEQGRLLDQQLSPRQSLFVNLNKWDIDSIFSLFSELGMAYEKKISNNISTFCCNALMFRTLQALEESKYDIPYIYLHLPCTVRAVSGIQNFDESKYLALVSRTQEMLVIISGYYRQ